jgi:hypothetical protein
MLPLQQYFNEERSMSFLISIPSWLRWVILLVAVLAIVQFVMGWLQNSAYKGMDHGLMSGFSDLVLLAMDFRRIVLPMERA